MSETKHTPGPWRLEKQVAGRDWTSIGAPVATVGGEALCESVEFIVGTVSDFGPHGEQETEANARLIAAAPDLLEACEYAVEHAEGLRRGTPQELSIYVVKLSEAIDKATEKEGGDA